MDEKTLKEIFDFLKAKGLKVNWQNDEPCLSIPYIYWEDNTKYSNQIFLFAGMTEFQTDLVASEWEEE